MWRIVLIAALVSGCTQVAQPLDPSNVYKRDVKILVDGVEHTGVAVLPGGQAKYTLEMTFAGRLDLFTLRSCHREVTQEEAGIGGIFGKKNKIKIDYLPVDPIESKSYCPLEIGGFEKDKGRHSWGFIDFKTPLETMPAVVLCNGVRQGFDGVSVCQSLVGLLQQVMFNEPMKLSLDKDNAEDCPEPKTADGKLFEFYPEFGRCVYAFRALGTGRFHRMTTIGYEHILIRGEAG